MSHASLTGIDVAFTLKLARKTGAIDDKDVERESREWGWITVS